MFTANLGTAKVQGGPCGRSVFHSFGRLRQPWATRCGGSLQCWWFGNRILALTIRWNGDMAGTYLDIFGVWWDMFFLNYHLVITCSYPLVIQHNYVKSPSFMSKAAIFNTSIDVTRGYLSLGHPWTMWLLRQGWPWNYSLSTWSCMIFETSYKIGYPLVIKHGWLENPWTEWRF